MSASETLFLAIVWPGNKEVRRKIWLAAVEDGQVARLESMPSRERAVQEVLKEAQANPNLIVGLDFPFSFPAWYVRHHSCANVREFWVKVRDNGLSWLDQPPFHARGSWNSGPFGGESCLRRTDIEVLGHPESVFKVVGPKQVAKGALTGIPALLALRDAGLAIWPFDRPKMPFALEIFPRALYDAPVTKSDEAARRSYLGRCGGSMEPRHRRDAERSDDAFDAVVSAHRMHRERESLAMLSGPLREYEIEGRIWAPTT